MVEEVDPQERGVDPASAIDNFPRLKAQTLSCTLGAPRSPQVVGDGSRAIFLRSDGSHDLVTSLWLSSFDGRGRHHEVLLADPRQLLSDADREDVPAEERARRERSREGNQGIVSYSVDEAGRRVVFTVGGLLWLVQIGDDGLTSSIRPLGGLKGGKDHEAILNPTISPDGSQVAYSTGRSMVLVRIGDLAEQDQVTPILTLGDEADDAISLGLAEFVAGEEMNRYQGFWWSPDSDALLVEKADASEEPVWYISDPANPQVKPRARRYPQALTKNARVELILIRLGQKGSPCRVAQVEWDHQAYEYLGLVRWQAGHQPLILVQNRRQTDDLILGLEVSEWLRGSPADSRVEGDDGDASCLGRISESRIATKELGRHHNDQWLDIIEGLPTFRSDGCLVDALIDTQSDTTRLRVDGRFFSPAGCQIRKVLSVEADDVLAVVSTDPRSMDLMRLGYDGTVHVLNRLPGIWTASRSGRGIVVECRTMASPHGQIKHCYLGEDSCLDRLGADGLGLITHDLWKKTSDQYLQSQNSMGMTTLDQSLPPHTVAPEQDKRSATPVRDHVDPGHVNHFGVRSAVLADHSCDPGFTPSVDFIRMGQHGLFAALVHPSDSSPYSRFDHLPVLLKPYGGPGAQQVVFNQSAYWESQWWADQGFLVLTVDGRGTPGRGPAWDRSIFKNMAQITLDDQLEALAALPDFAPEADLDHVAMIGWSYGGFLSALSVLRAPDQIHAACAGAPPTDWTLYDTHYTERYLGMDPGTYQRNSLIGDAAGLRRPLMLIHGFADDNVTIANTLRLSNALMEAGRDHTVLPLTGITHMTKKETVAKNLLTLQRDFLYKALNLEDQAKSDTVDSSD